MLIFILNLFKSIYNNIKTNIFIKTTTTAKAISTTEKTNNANEIYDNSYCNAEYMLTKEQSLFIYKISYLCLLTSLINCYSNPLVSIQTFLVHLTSRLYWCKPLKNSYRRYLDIIVVVSIIVSNFVYSIYNNNNYTYLTIQSLAIICYPLSYYYYNKKLFWLSTYIHSLVHIFSNIAAVTLVY